MLLMEKERKMNNKIKMNGHSITASNISEILLINDEVQQKVLENKKALEDMIAELPDNFPEANPTLRSEIFPQMLEMDDGFIDYYTVKIHKRLSVGKQTIKESFKSYKRELQLNLSEFKEIFTDNDYEEEIDPEIIKQADQIALDPQVFKKRIDMVNDLGIIKERLNIGVICMTIDSRLNPMGIKGSNVLAAKNTGTPGAGKSATLMTTLQLYSEKCYHLIDNGSAKSIYNMEKNALKHKTLILNEAFAFEGNNSSDSEFAHVVRCLLSEGSVKYQYTSFDADGNKITKTQTVYGPTPLITTSIHGSHEKQLDDRMFNIHPNISSQQTSAVISIEAQQASGILETIDERKIQAWHVFHDSLEVMDVVIPFAPDLHAYFVKSGDLPVAARRAFKRVMTSIKTISLLYQKQRLKDDQGRVIAEIQDYALAHQLIDRAFRESLGGGKYINRRLQTIDRFSPITPRDLAKKEGVSGAAISEWSKSWLEKGVLIWCDDQGVTIKEDQLNKMKRSGKAYLKVVGVNRLPTPFELTGDQRWDVGGEFYQTYDLGLKEELLNNNKELSEILNTSNTKKTNNSIDIDGGVRVLREKPPKFNNIKGFEDITL